MLLLDKLEYVFFLMESFSARFYELTPLSRRMYATGIINDMYSLVSQLTEIDEQLDSALCIEDAYLDISLWDDRKFDFQSLFDEKEYKEDTNNDSNINKLIDILPLNNDDYSFTSDKAERFKTGMRYLCSDANISSRDIVYALNKGITSIFSLLQSIKHKKSKVQDYQYEDFWNEFLFRDDDLLNERATNDYEKWKEEHDWHDIQVLKDKRTQEILKMLQSGVFNHDVIPVKRDLAKSIIEIPEDALEEGTEIPKDTRIECARFSKYVTFKEDILCLDYKKLGKYIYMHYGDIKNKQGDSLIYFVNLLSHIQNDMAECKPKLKQYLKFYEDNLLEETLNYALTILNSCKGLLKDGVANNFLIEYLKAASIDKDTKNEVQAKLKGQSRFTLICNMLGMLKSTSKVFKLGTTSADLAKALAPVVEKPKSESLKRYIDKGASDVKSKLSKWTTAYVLSVLGNKSERLFWEVSQK